jgi:hypothetical protein
MLYKLRWQARCSNRLWGELLNLICCPSQKSKSAIRQAVAFTELWNERRLARGEKQISFTDISQTATRMASSVHEAGDWFGT